MHKNMVKQWMSQFPTKSSLKIKTKSSFALQVLFFYCLWLHFVSHTRFKIWINLWGDQMFFQTDFFTQHYMSKGEREWVDQVLIYIMLEKLISIGLFEVYEFIKPLQAFNSLMNNKIFFFKFHFLNTMFEIFNQSCYKYLK